VADIEGIKVLNFSTQKRAKKLSEKYNVPLINSESAETYVSIDDQSILHSGNYKLENSFREGKFRARISQYQGESLLKKAIGWQSTSQKHILDTTGGLGHDAFILALLGQKITVLEKNTGLCILIEEALNNLPNLPYFNHAKNNISVINNDSRAFLSSAENFDVIYVDPMFNSKKKLKRTKQMQFLDNYLEEYDDPSVEFYKSNFKRLVIKKELRAAPSIKGCSAISFKGSSVRYDVYSKGEK
jgi:16S rRNA G966 N2-methylase RsmD